MNTQQNHDLLQNLSKQGLMIINGRTIDLFNLKENSNQLEFSILSKGLTNIIRFNGFSNYNVACHSLVLSYMVENFLNKHILKKVFNNFEYEVDLILMEKLLIDKDNEKVSSFFLPLIKALKTENKCINFQNKAKFIIFSLLAKMASYDALVHDLSETLTGDIIRPFKILIPEIGIIADKVDVQIREHYKTYKTMPSIVDIFDKQMATVEAYYLTRFHNVNLIDVTDEFHVKSFNSTFFNSEKSELVTHLLGLSDKYKEKPLNEVFINHFLTTSLPYSYDEIEKKKIDYASQPISISTLIRDSKEDVLLKMNHRFITLRKDIDSLFKELKDILIKQKEMKLKTPLPTDLLHFEEFSDFIKSTY